MNSQHISARRIGIGLVAACSLVLTACAAGQHAATARQTPAIDGVDGSVGSLDIRSVSIVAPPNGAASYAAGSTVVISAVFVNNGGAGDTLTGVSTSAATGWAVYNSAAEASAAATASSSGGASATASASQSASPSGSVSVSPSASASPSLPVGAKSVELPAGQSTAFGVPSSQKVLVLVGLAQQLFPAQIVQITFTFAKAGTVTLPVPVQLSSGAAGSTVPADTGSAG